MRYVPHSCRAFVISSRIAQSNDVQLCHADGQPNNCGDRPLVNERAFVDEFSRPIARTFPHSWTCQQGPANKDLVALTIGSELSSIGCLDVIH